VTIVEKPSVECDTDGVEDLEDVVCYLKEEVKMLQRKVDDLRKFAFDENNNRFCSKILSFFYDETSCLWE